MKYPLLVALLLCSISCSTTPEEQKIHQATAAPKPKITKTVVGVIDTLPDEYVGAGCWYARTAKEYKRGDLICAQSQVDHVNVIAMNLNGRFEVLAELKTVIDEETGEVTLQTFGNDDWSAVIESSDVGPRVDYNSYYAGTLRLIERRRHKDTMFVRIYEECGC